MCAGRCLFLFTRTFFPLFFPHSFNLSVCLPPHVSAGFIVCLKASREEGVDEEKIEKDAKVRHLKAQQKNKQTNNSKQVHFQSSCKSVACCWLRLQWSSIREWSSLSYQIQFFHFFQFKSTPFKGLKIIVPPARSFWDHNMEPALQPTSKNGNKEMF